VAAQAGIARQTLGRWYARWVSEGYDGLLDRSSRPLRCPSRTPAHIEDRSRRFAASSRFGPVQLAARLAEEGICLAVCTVWRILVRRGISRLRDLDISGADLREPGVRYEWARPGDMVHVDVKKLGRIPAGGGHRIHGRASGQHRAAQRAKGRGAKAGYIFVHTAIDDHSRLAYSEELGDERGATAAAFWARAVKFFRRHGIGRIRRVLTDNGSCYRSAAFAAALLATRTRHKRTRPYQPQTNGKVERFHRTLAREWAYVRAWDSNEHRGSALRAFLERYNYRRPHTALGGKPPISRCPGVTNLAA
jgi:transposase InsO family protein